MKRSAAFLVAILMVLGACGGASGPGAGAPAASAPGAAAQPQGCGPKGSGSLTILGTPQEEYIPGVPKTFEAECGIRM